MVGRWESFSTKKRFSSQVAQEAAHGDGLADAALPDDEGDAAELGPHLQAGEQLALAAGVKHVGGGHVLAEGHLGEAEVGLQSALVLRRDGGGVHGQSSFVERALRMSLEVEGHVLVCGVLGQQALEHGLGALGVEGAVAVEEALGRCRCRRPRRRGVRPAGRSTAWSAAWRWARACSMSALAEGSGSMKRSARRLPGPGGRASRRWAALAVPISRRRVCLRLWPSGAGDAGPRRGDSAATKRPLCQTSTSSQRLGVVAHLDALLRASLESDLVAAAEEREAPGLVRRAVLAPQEGQPELLLVGVVDLGEAARHRSSGVWPVSEWTVLL